MALLFCVGFIRCYVKVKVSLIEIENFLTSYAVFYWFPYFLLYFINNKKKSLLIISLSFLFFWFLHTKKLIISFYAVIIINNLITRKIISVKVAIKIELELVVLIITVICYWPELKWEWEKIDETKLHKVPIIILTVIINIIQYDILIIYFENFIIFHKLSKFIM